MGAGGDGVNIASMNRNALEETLMCERIQGQAKLGPNDLVDTCWGVIFHIWNLCIKGDVPTSECMASE